MPQELISKRLTLLVRPEVVIDLEYTPQFPVLHFFKTGNFTKETYKFCIDYSAKLHEFFTDVGYLGTYAAVIDHTGKTQKLCSKIGFEFQTQETGEHEGKTYLFDVFTYKGLENGSTN